MSRCFPHQELLQAQVCLLFLPQRSQPSQGPLDLLPNLDLWRKGLQLSLQPPTKPDTTTPSVHEPNCSQLHSHPGRAPSSPNRRAGETPPPAQSDWLLPTSFQAAVPFRGRSPPGLWDSPEGPASPRREVLHSQHWGTKPPLEEPLPAQRTSSAVRLVPALCSCSCGLLPGPPHQAACCPAPH